MIDIDGEFSHWLVAHKGLGNASSSDVVSRIRRINGFIDLDPREDEEKLLYLVSVCPTFKGLSQCVKSQLRRAIKLYKEYASGKAAG